MQDVGSSPTSQAIKDYFMEYFLIYLIGVVDNLKEFFHFFGSISLIACLVAFCIFKLQSSSEYNSKREEERFNKGASISLKWAIIYFSFVFLSLLIPNSKTLVAMVTIPPVINNEQVQELPENVLGFINDYIKEKRDELQGISGSSGDL